MLKIYFAASIRGGREDRAIYELIIRHLQKYGEVLTEHIGDASLTPSGEAGLTDREIYQRDLDWLGSADMVVAEVTTPSLGVGFEIAKAVDMGKKVLCLFRETAGRRLSAMIAGCPDPEVLVYKDMDEVVELLGHYFAGK